MDQTVRTTGFEQVMPSATDAKGWHNLNRKQRRASLAKSQAGRAATVDDDGKVLPKRLRLKTHAAKVAFERGLEAHGA